MCLTLRVRCKMFVVLTPQGSLQVSSLEAFVFAVLFAQGFLFVVLLSIVMFNMLFASSIAGGAICTIGQLLHTCILFNA